MLCLSNFSLRLPIALPFHPIVFTTGDTLPCHGMQAHKWVGFETKGDAASVLAIQHTHPGKKSRVWFFFFEVLGYSRLHQQRSSSYGGTIHMFAMLPLHLCTMSP